MKRMTPSVKSTLRRLGVVIGAAALFSAIPNTTNATQTVRELWDGNSGNHSIDGVVSNGVSSVGFDASKTWVTSPPGNTSFHFDGWNLDWHVGDGDTLLPSTANGNGGLLAYYGSDGNMDSTLTNAATGLPYGDYYSQCYAMRALTTNAHINFQSDGTNYFSVRFVGGGGYNWWSGDMAGGIGFASSSGTNAHFAGAGWTKNSYIAVDGSTDIGRSIYISTGTLDQSGIESHPDDSGGPYYTRAYGTPGALGRVDSGSGNTYGTGALLLGQLITTASGASTLNVLLVPAYGYIPTDPTTITWDATYSFQETNIMSHLLMWEYGNGGPRVQDSIRVGTSYGDAVGVEIVGNRNGGPNVSPSSTVYAGTPVTFSTIYAGLNTTPFPLSYQWFSNSVPLTDAISSTLVLTNPTTDYTADYSLVIANAYGAATSAVTHLTVNPAVPVFITQQPVAATRYLGSPAATFAIGVDGTPPFTFQWKHANTNIQTAVTNSFQNNTLSLPPITLADAGNYSVSISNPYGSVDSSNAALTVSVPAAGSYSAAITALSPWGYWRLDDALDTNNLYTVVYDYFGYHNGLAIDTNRMTFQDVGAPFLGFPANHQGITIGANGSQWQLPYRLNAAKLPIYTTNMTFTAWVKGAAKLMTDGGHMYGLDRSSGGTLQFDWGGYDSFGSKTNVMWDSGLTLPANAWSFVALVVNPTTATIYVGADRFSLTSASVDLATILDLNGGPCTVADSDSLGDTSGLAPLAIGRDPVGWADSGGGAPWTSVGGTWSDVAVVYQALSAQQVTNLYQAGIGLAIAGEPDGGGNLNLNWFPVYTLQEATSVNGPWSDVSGSPAPPYSVPISAAITQHYYRVRK